MKIKSRYFLVLMNCFLTILTQKIYHYTPVIDGFRYLEMARQYSHFNFFDPYTNCVARPLYPIFLAIFGSVVSYNLIFIALVQSLLFCFSALLLVGELEKKLNRNLTGLLVILFLVPEMHFFNGSVFTEALAYSLIMLTFYAGLKIHNSSATTSKLFLLSVIMGLTILNRFESIVILVPVLFFIYPKIKTKLLTSILICLIFPVAFLALNGLKNYKIFGVYKLSAFNGGETIFGGNSENLDGSHHDFQRHKEIYIPKDRIADLDKILAQPQCVYCPQSDSFFFRLAIEAWKKNPIQQLGVIPEKFAKNWLLPGNFDIYTRDSTKTRGLQMQKILSGTHFRSRYAPYKHLFYMSIHWALLLMLCIGIFKYKRDDRFQSAVLILLAFYILYTIPFSGLPRWHVSIFPLLIIAFTPKLLIERVNRIFNTFTKRHSANSTDL
jgi:hypothetical protein